MQVTVCDAIVKTIFFYKEEDKRVENVEKWRENGGCNSIKTAKSRFKVSCDRAIVN